MSMIPPGHKFAHATTAQLPWHLQKCVLIWSLYSTYEYNVFLQDFDNEPINFCKMDPRATAWFRLNTDWGKLINLIMITSVSQNQPFGAWMGNCSTYHMDTHGILFLHVFAHLGCFCPPPSFLSNNGLDRCITMYPGPFYPNLHFKQMLICRVFRA